MQTIPIGDDVARLVAPGIWKIILPIPFPLRTVNVYALVGEDEWALVDAGIGVPEARAALYAGLERAGLHIEQMSELVLTHHHPDHVGLSAELYQLSGARVYMHPIDEKILRIITTGAQPERARFLDRHGLPPAELWYDRVPTGIMRSVVAMPPPEAFTPLADNQEIILAGKRYLVYWVPGHSDGQITLFRISDGVYLSADHVLPRITPNIGLYTAESRPDPLGDYLSSLAKAKLLHAQNVLPGHGEPFRDLAGRIEEIALHHDERLQQMQTLLAEQPLSAYQLTQHLFGDRLKNNEVWRMAVAEVVAHLEYLRLRQRVHQEWRQDILYYSVD